MLIYAFSHTYNSEWTEEGQLWVQYVSSTPATRLDVISLQEQLDQKLQQRQARETGICPIREELYAQCFGKCCFVDCLTERVQLVRFGCRSMFHYLSELLLTKHNRRGDPTDHDKLWRARIVAPQSSRRHPHDNRRISDFI